MTTKLKIDLEKGMLEVEGSETFVKTIYNDFKTHFVGIEQEDNGKTRRTRSRMARKTVAKSVVLLPEQEADEKTTVPKRKKAPAPTYNIIENLELEATTSHYSLMEFMDSKFPITNEERNIVFIYYLQYIIKVKLITLDHIYTCYRATKIRAPLNIETNLKMTLDNHNWLRIAKNGKLSLTADGKKYVEKQLPKKVKS